MRNPYKAKLQALNLPYKTILGTASAKTVKGEKIGYLTAIVYLKPSIKICPLSKLAGCLNPCLATAGRGAFNSVQLAREAKTRFYFENREAFLLSIAADIWSLCNRAKNRGLTPLVRLNGTSDIDYENLIVCDNKNIFQLFPNTTFYDYTKHPSRNLTGKTPGNYDLTYSYSGITPHNVTIKGILNPSNSRVAVVFQKQQDIPSTFRGWTTIDGDNTDVRHIEPKTVVVALYAKGKAKNDYSGFTQIKGRDYA
jgi:Gene product 88